MLTVKPSAMRHIINQILKIREKGRNTAGNTFHGKPWSNKKEKKRWGYLVSTASLLTSIRRFLTLSCKHGRWHVRIKTFAAIKHKNKDPSWWPRVAMGPGVSDIDLSKGRPGTRTQGAWCLTQDPFIWTTRLNLNLKHKEQKFVLGMWKLSGMGGRGTLRALAPGEGANGLWRFFFHWFLGTMESTQISRAK